MGKIKRALIIWLLKQLGIEESHIQVVVGELTIQEARRQKAQEEFSSYVAILDKVYGKQDPFIPGDTRPRGRAHIYFIANRRTSPLVDKHSAIKITQYQPLGPPSATAIPTSDCRRKNSISPNKCLL